MVKLRVTLPPEDKEIEISRSGQPILGVFLDADGYAYPSDDWTDFAILLLTWWASQLSHLWSGGRVATLSFIEGPYRVRVRRRRYGLLELFPEGRGESWTSDLTELTRALIDAGGEMLERWKADPRIARPLSGLESAINGLAAQLAGKSAVN